MWPRYDFCKNNLINNYFSDYKRYYQKIVQGKNLTNNLFFQVHKGIRWPCDLCEYVGGYKGDLNRHKKIVHDGFILECSQCEFKTPKKYTLKEHFKLQHGVDSIEEDQFFRRDLFEIGDNLSLALFD